MHDYQGICGNNLNCVGENGLPVKPDDYGNKPEGVCSKLLTIIIH